MRPETWEEPQVPELFFLSLFSNFSNIHTVILQNMKSCGWGFCYVLLMSLRHCGYGAIRGTHSSSLQPVCVVSEFIQTWPMIQKWINLRFMLLYIVSSFLIIIIFRFHQILKALWLDIIDWNAAGTGVNSPLKFLHAQPHSDIVNLVFWWFKSFIQIWATEVLQLRVM